MKNSNMIFVIWGIIVVILVGLLTVLGFMLKGETEKYETLEKRLVEVASSYAEAKALVPEDKEELKILTKDLIEEGSLKLEELKVGKDVCEGYVILKKDIAYKYEAYIKCNNYVTKGYKK